MATIYNTPLSTASEKALFGRPGGGEALCMASLSLPLLQGFQRFTIFMCSDAELHVEFQTTWREIKDG